MTKYYVDAAGAYLGGFAGPIVGGAETKHPDVPKGAVEVADAPEDARQVWSGTAWALPIAETRAAGIAALKRDYQAALDMGVTFNAASFQSDAPSMQQLAEVLTALGNGWPLPTGFAWIDAANAPHPADLVFLQGLAAAFADHKSALFARWQIARAKVQAATTKTAINKVVL